MRRKRRKRMILTLGVFLTLTGCAERIADTKDLSPAERRPLHTLRVADATEAELLAQEFGLQIVRVEGTTVYFSGADSALLARLRKVGYAPRQADPLKSYYRVVKVTKKGELRDLQARGLQFINREREHWVVRGSLEQLRGLRDAGYRLEPLTEEVRPRHVRILVKGPEHVQRVAETNVDIYNAQKWEAGTVMIYAGAFDYQIDLLTAKGYQVAVIP